MLQGREIMAETKVLIETLWNVKFKFFSSPGERSFSFNRNIVECKGCFSPEALDLVLPF